MEGRKAYPRGGRSQIVRKEDELDMNALENRENIVLNVARSGFVEATVLSSRTASSVFRIQCVLLN
jgi:hypothetical protein